MTTTAKLRWIEDTQTFQRIAGVAVSSAEDLSSEWDAMKPSLRDRAAESAREHRIIQDAAIRAARGSASPVVGPSSPVSAADAKRAFTARHLDDLTARFLAVLDSHPTLFALPEADRANAARCAATHAMLAVRSGSVALVGDP